MLVVAVVANNFNIMIYKGENDAIIFALIVSIIKFLLRLKFNDNIILSTKIKLKGENLWQD